MFFKIFSTVLLKVGLKFAKIFEVGDHNDNWLAAENLQDDGGSESSLSSPNSSSQEKERKKEMDEPTESSSSTLDSCGLSTAASAAPYPLNRSFHLSFQHVQLTIEPEPHHWQPLTSFSRTTPLRNLYHFLIHISDPSKGN